jgi:hypothetical protein
VAFLKRYPCLHCFPSSLELDNARDVVFCVVPVLSHEGRAGDMQEKVIAAMSVDLEHIMSCRSECIMSLPF